MSWQELHRIAKRGAPNVVAVKKITFDVTISDTVVLMKPRRAARAIRFDEDRDFWN